MKRILVFCAFLALPGLGLSQISVQAPASRDDVKACADYADEVLHDRWDMNERTDLGWRTFNTVELPKSNLTGITFSGGIFSAVSSSTDPDANITLLDSHYPGSAELGKIGANFPIDAGRYRTLALRMYVPSPLSLPNGSGQLFWSKNTMYGGMTTSNAFVIGSGWRIYMIDIPALGIAAGSDAWSGWIDSLRLDPFNYTNKEIRIDWIRLVQEDAALRRTIRWSGNSGNVDIYIDNDRDPSATLGILAANRGGTSYEFPAGALAPGEYYVAVAPAGTANLTYAPGSYRINDPPIITVDSPSAEGGTDDFVTTAFADPWDLANSQDVEHTERLVNPSLTALDYQDLKGTSFSGQSVLRANSNGGDPNVFFLHFLYRGSTTSIDTSKYHNLVFKMGIEGAQSVNDGSIARVMWRIKGESLEHVSQDIIIHHLPGSWVMNKVVCDLRTLPLEAEGSQTGWSGLVDTFRIDPHEFSDGRAFFIDDVKLTADCRADASFSIAWSLADSDSTPAVSLYYDTDRSGYDGTLIAAIPSASPGQRTTVWDTSSVDQGTYWVYAIVDDGVNQNRAYATGPLVIDHALVPVLALSKTRVNLGSVEGGSSTGTEEVLVTNSGQGTLHWTAQADRSWISVTPQSGTGDAAIRIGVAPGSLAVGSYQGKVRISDPAASNSPRTIDVALTVYGSWEDPAPFGIFETPVEGVTVSGNIPVTGWALDNVQVTRIELRRSVDPADPPAAVGSDGLIYVGDATFVKGARPDVEAAYPGYPRADRAGWGYMLLTNFLANQGNGTFNLYAIAHDSAGKRTTLGRKTIVCDNAGRTKPFGTIDTPSQGGIVTGTFVNFGWALTPQPKIIPTDGSTIWVYVDSVALGHPVYNNYRSDIATAFPSYANSNGAVGYFYIDTNALSDGTHSIGWTVTDDAGSTDGIGSRFFEVRNRFGISSMTMNVRAPSLPVDTAGILFVEVKGPREIEIEECEPLEIRLSGRGKFAGWSATGYRDLPVGSTLDGEQGVFYWRPGPGFLGTHVLHFAATDGRRRSDSIAVVVHIRPRGTPAPAARERETPKRR